VAPCFPVLQIADIQVNDQALEDAQKKLEDIRDQLRKRTHEQVCVRAFVGAVAVEVQRTASVANAGG